MTKNSDDGRFEWDTEKNEINRQKHGFGFEEILEIFDDPFFYEIYDTAHSTNIEERFIGIGEASGILVITACYTERKKIRLISARAATKTEEKRYYANKQNFNA